MRKIRRIIIIVLVLIPVLLVGPWLICPLLNDAKAGIMASRMLYSTAPERTEIIEVVSGCGNTSGTGNHVEVWIGLLVHSYLSQAELEAFYAASYDSIRVHDLAADPDHPYPREMTVLKLDFKTLQGLSNRQGYFVIGRTETPISSNFDLRGY